LELFRSQQAVHHQQKRNGAMIRISARSYKSDPTSLTQRQAQTGTESG
jgi:hypothetical protein